MPTPLNKAAADLLDAMRERAFRLSDWAKIQAKLAPMLAAASTVNPLLSTDHGLRGDGTTLVLGEGDHVLRLEFRLLPSGYVAVLYSGPYLPKRKDGAPGEEVLAVDLPAELSGNRVSEHVAAFFVRAAKDVSAEPTPPSPK